MTLPSSPNSISFRQINEELGRSVSDQLSINSSGARLLAGRTTSGSSISMSNFRGKSYNLVATQTGGAIYDAVYGGLPYKLYIFNGSGTLTITQSPSYVLVDTVVVAGGGAGGYNTYTGAGGGGGVDWRRLVMPVGTYTITVGAGGVMPTNGESTSSHSTWGNTFTNGGNSSIIGPGTFNITASGGETVDGGNSNRVRRSGNSGLFFTDGNVPGWPTVFLTQYNGVSYNQGGAGRYRSTGGAGYGNPRNRQPTYGSLAADGGAPLGLWAGWYSGGGGGAGQKEYTTVGLGGDDGGQGGTTDNSNGGGGNGGNGGNNIFPENGRANTGGGGGAGGGGQVAQQGGNGGSGRIILRHRVYTPEFPT